MPTDLDPEDELLRRFQALRSTPSDAPSEPSSFKRISDQQAKKATDEDDELERIAAGRFPSSSSGTNGSKARDGSGDDVIRRRMAALRGVEPEEEEEGDEEVKAFIASLSDSTAPPTASGSSDSASKFIRETRPTSTESLDLDKEAKRALDATNGYLENAKDGVEDQGGEEEDFETEDEILMRALEEAELEVDMDIKSGKKRSEHRVDKDGIANEDETEHDILARAKALAAASSAGPDTPRVTSSGPESPKLSFPSLPSHLPKEEEDTEDALDAEARARMEMLLGLSGPSTKPGAPKLPSPPKDVGGQRNPGQGWNLPGYKDDMDDDPDSWCCICNKDAEVVCLGCEGDPYCEECWREGHVGERHRTKRFTSRKGRKAIGA